MNQHQTIPIASDLDIIEARMQVRRLAREVGLDLFDQARISLATSTLAIILGLEKGGNGSITMGCVERDGRRGVEVTCSRHARADPPLDRQRTGTSADGATGNGARYGLAYGVLDDARRMVDDLRVDSPQPCTTSDPGGDEKDAGGGVAVTIVKWVARNRRRTTALPGT